MLNSEISKYTISVYELIENKFDFGLDKYEIFDEAYREKLNNAILEYYMFREIAYVNPTVWRQRLTSRMNLIMRNKYNQLYTSKLKEFNPLYTMEMYEDYMHSITTTGATTATGEVNYNTTSTNATTTGENNSVDNTTINHETSEDNVNGQTTKTSSTSSSSSNYPSEEFLNDNLDSNLFVDNGARGKGTENTLDATGTTGKVDNTNTVEQAEVKSGTLNANLTGVDKTTNENSGTTSNTTTETYHKKSEGSASDLTFAHAMTQFKEFVEKFQLDNEVIADLKDLFIQIW